MRVSASNQLSDCRRCQKVGLGVKVGLDSSDVEYELGVASYIQQAMVSARARAKQGDHELTTYAQQPLFSSLNPVVRGVSGSIALAFGMQVHAPR